MSNSNQTVDDATMNCGLLMESAQAHQKMAEAHLDQLRAYTLGLDGVVRDAIARTLVEELKMLTVESERAAAALQSVGRSASLRTALWSVLVAFLCSGVPAAIFLRGLPSESEMTALRARRDQLAASVEKLEQQGGLIDWRHCGDTARVCVRVDRNSPKYGDKSDYYVAAGY